MATVPADEVYAQQLFKCAQGYPLWQPDPSKDSIEVMIGDVGYLHRGGFYRIFNATKDANDPINTNGVPNDFEKFQAGNLAPQRVEAAIAAGPLYSKTMRQLSIEGEVSAHGVGASCHFECTDDQGAVLILKASGAREELHQVRRMKNYMSKNVSSWWNFATETLGLEKNEEEILFVRGWVKTTHWAVAAFTHHGKSAKLKFNGNFGLPASAAFQLQVSHQTVTSCEHRSGPESRQPQHAGRRRGGGRNERTNDQSPPDQCVFLHYFKLKKRFFGLKTITAAAEPQDPSFGSEDGDTIEEVPPLQKAWDPVDYVLDYILRHSDAEAAIASDNDIIDLCKRYDDSEYPIPDDIPAFLEQVQPHIEVTEEGLGMLNLEENVAPVLPDIGQGSTEPVADPPMDTAEDNGAPPAPAGNDGEDDDEDRAANVGKGKGPANNLPGGESLFELLDEEHRGGICALAYSPDGNYVAGGFEDSSVIIWSSNTRRRIHEMRGHFDAICSLEFSPNSLELVSGSRDSRVIIWSVIDGSQSTVLAGHSGFVNSVAYSPDGQTVASASVDFTMRLWNAETGALKAASSQHDAMVMFVTFSPDGSRLVSASADCIARVWSAEDGVLIAELDTHEGVIYSIAFSHDGRRLVTSSDDGTVRIWSAISGDEFVTLREHSGSVWAAAFSPDGKQILSVASDRTIKICDSYSGELISTIEGGDRLVNAATFSPNADYVAAGGEDHAVNVWDTKTGAHVAAFGGHTDNINRLRFSRNGRRIVSSSDDSTVRLFVLPEAQLVIPVA